MKVLVSVRVSGNKQPLWNIFWGIVLKAEGAAKSRRPNLLLRILYALDITRPFEIWKLGWTYYMRWKIQKIQDVNLSVGESLSKIPFSRPSCPRTMVKNLRKIKEEKWEWAERNEVLVQFQLLLGRRRCLPSILAMMDFPTLRKHDEIDETIVLGAGGLFKLQSERLAVWLPQF